MSGDASELAREIRATPPGAMRWARGTVVPAATKSSALSAVSLADGHTIDAPGAMVVGSEVQLLVGGGVVMPSGCLRYGCEVERTAGQTAGSASTTILSWPTVVQDTHSFVAANGNTITIRHAGLYALTFSATMSAAVSGRSFVQLVTSGSKVRVERYWLAAGEDKGASSAVLALKVGDTVQASVYHTTGSTLTVTGSCEVWRIAW